MEVQIQLLPPAMIDQAQDISDDAKSRNALGDGQLPIKPGIFGPYDH